jgi:phosphoribosylamine-glycine ligase
VIGTGGREHALALALSRDPSVTEVHAAPGNPGVGEVATLHPWTRWTARPWRPWPQTWPQTWS